MVKIKCSYCDKETDQHKIVSCSLCKQIFNYTCVKLSQSEARSINTNKSVNWTCTRCLPLAADISALKELVIGLQKEIADLKTQGMPNNSSEYDFEEIVKEMQQREKRKVNVIVYGIKEEQMVNRLERETSDKQKTNNIFEAISVNCHIIKSQRLGVFDPSRETARPLKISFDDENVVHNVIKKSKQLRGLDEFKGIRISYDRTPRQMMLYKRVREELRRRTADGETNLIIKYIKGVPKIIEQNLI